MTDEWARTPDGSPSRNPDLDPFEVPLVGDDHDATSSSVPEAPPRTDRRRAVIVALAIGAVLGVGATVVRTTTDDDDATDSTAPSEDAASAITTPATLAPFDTLPSPDDPAFRRDSIDEGPQPTTSQDRSLFDGVILPTYPTVDDVGPAELEQYDIAGAVEMLADDVPRRGETHLELGSAGFVLDVTIERDPARNRYRIVLDSGGRTQIAIVDVATDTTYISDDSEDGGIEIPNADILEGASAVDVNDYFDRLLLGPVRPDSFDAAATRGRGVVTIDEVGLARQFIANVRGDLIPEWQLYAFSPVFEFPVEDRPSLLEYSVYVTEDGRIAQVDGLSLVGDVPQLVLHRLVRLDEPIVIELPSEVVPTTTAPTAATTAPTEPTVAPSTSAPDAPAG